MKAYTCIVTCHVVAVFMYSLITINQKGDVLICMNVGKNIVTGMIVLLLCVNTLRF